MFADDDVIWTGAKMKTKTNTNKTTRIGGN